MMAALVLSVVILLSYLGNFNSVQASRIILMPFPYRSHVGQLVAIGDGLFLHGHEVFMLLSTSYPELDKVKGQGGIKVITYEAKDTDIWGMPEDDAEEMWQLMLDITPIQDFRQNTEGFIQFCTNPLSDDAMYKELKGLKLDLAVVDVFPNTRCLHILCYRLGIPYISSTTTYEPWLMRVPALPSFVPFPLAQRFTEDMTFMERLFNTIILLDWTIFTEVPSVDDSLVAKYAPEKPVVTLNYLASRSLLWFIDTDFAIDYPRPMMANEVNIGGISTRPAKSLPPDLKQFVDSATDGVIVVSFGTHDALPPNVYEKFMAAFVQINQKVIWRYKYDFPPDVPEHIKLMDWIPQNDIMGHPNTKLLITHGGGNSQFEALYHGIPVISFPIFADQPYNAKRAEYHGFGITMDLRAFMPDQLIRAIDNICADPTYSENIKKRSQIFQSAHMTPKDRAVYWVEHVLKFGGAHLHSSALDMPWYQLLMLDILAVVLVVLHIACYTVYKLIIFVLSRCQGKDKEKLL